VLDLAVAVHALEGLSKDAQAPRDAAEDRNSRLFADLTGESRMLSTRISGTFKPSDFIHPFEEHYSLPGYLDVVVLPHFAEAVDTRAAQPLAPSDVQGQAELLAFVYMFFLLVHPFVDRNGRVARSLLEYYHARLTFTCPCYWRTQEPRLVNAREHRAAFRAFFETVGLPRRSALDPYPVPEALRSALQAMADRLVEWAVSFQNRPVDHPLPPYHQAMASLLLNGPAPNAARTTTHEGSL